jgi:hypothetical protein
MDFRPTIKKVIMSIIIAIVVWMLTYVRTIYFVGEKYPILSTSSWLTIFSFILVYVIWSLIQNRKKRR